MVVTKLQFNPVIFAYDFKFQSRIITKWFVSMISTLKYVIIRYYDNTNVSVGHQLANNFAWMTLILIEP
jgi:hypothetical protein